MNLVYDYRVELHVVQLFLVHLARVRLYFGIFSAALHTLLHRNVSVRYQLRVHTHLLEVHDVHVSWGLKLFLALGG